MNMDPKALFELARQSEQKMKEFEKQKEQITGTGNAGADMVSVTVNGLGHVTKLSIAPELCSVESKDMLEVLLSSAIGEAMDKMNKAVAEATKTQAMSMLSGLQM